MTLVPEERDLIVRLADLQARIQEMTAEAEGLKAELRGYPPGDYDAGRGAKFRIMPTRRFDPEAALLLVPGELRAGCWVQTIDAAKVRSYLAPAYIESCMVESGKPKVMLL